MISRMFLHCVSDLVWLSQLRTKDLLEKVPGEPPKGQKMVLQALPGFHLRHTIYAYGMGGLSPNQTEQSMSDRP
jgi:hypothetical protein